MPPALQSVKQRRLALVCSLALAGIIALSIHVGMLAAGIPFPVSQPPLWARWLSNSLIVGAILVFLRLAHPSIGHCSASSRVLITAALLCAIQETLRAAIMSGVVTTAWSLSTIGLVRSVCAALLLAFLSVITVRWVRSVPSMVIAALLISAVYVAARMLEGAALAPLLEHLASLSRPAAYSFPYPFHINVMAYLTFTEPVVGVTVMTWLVWDRLPASMAARLLALALLAALLKGVVGMTTIYSFFMAQSPLLGMLSWSQFLFEFLALGFLVGLAWERFARMPQAQSVAASGEAGD